MSSLTSVFSKTNINKIMLTSLFWKINVVFLELNLSPPLLALTLNHLSLPRTLRGGTATPSSLTLGLSSTCSHSHSHALSAMVSQPLIFDSRALISRSHSQLYSLSHSCSRSMSWKVSLLWMLVSVFGFDGDGKWEARASSFYYLNLQCITNMKILVNSRIAFELQHSITLVNVCILLSHELGFWLYLCANWV